MPVPDFGAAGFATAFQKLFPRGWAWPREPDAIQTQLAAALTPTYERQATDAANLIADAFPATAVELLPEWESTLGLPDPCAGPDPTIALRQQQVVARFAGRGGQSVAYFIAYAAQLGVPITVQEFAPARVGFTTVGQPINGPAWAFAWQVTAPATVEVYAVVGAARVGDPLATWGSEVLECELGEIKPAHTVLTFAYSGAGSTAPLDEFVLDKNVLA